MLYKQILITFILLIGPQLPNDFIPIKNHLVKGHDFLTNTIELSDTSKKSQGQVFDSTITNENIGQDSLISNEADSVSKAEQKEAFTFLHEFKLKIVGLWSWIDWKWASGILLPVVLFILKIYWTNIRRYFTLSEERYFDNLITQLNKKSYQNFPELKLISEPIKNGKEKATFSELISSGKSIQVIGKPGSGKTSLVRKIALELCSDRSMLPVFVEYNGDNLFNQIIHSLTIHDLVHDPSLLDENWLIKQLKKKNYLIIIDDIHQFITDNEKVEKSRVKNLLHYKNKKAQFVLISRDYYSNNPFNLPLYKIEYLNENTELAEKVLKVHTDERKGNAVWRHLGHGRNEKMELYNTPQLLKIFATVFDEQRRFDESRSLLFERFIEYRDKEERQKNISGNFPLQIKNRILGYLANQFFMQPKESPYSVSYEDFLAFLKQGIDKARDTFGINQSVDTIEEVLLSEGYLVKIDKRIQFEHDQLQEYFAATEILYQNHSIAPFLKENYGREVILFICGFYSPKKYLTNKNTWNNYWENILISDHFLMAECIQAQILSTLGDRNKIFNGFTYSEEELHSAYGEFLRLYDKAIQKHFPKLTSKFAPTGNFKTGLLIEKSDSELDLMYGFRPVTAENNEKLIIADQEKIAKLMGAKDPGESINYYFKNYDLEFFHNYGGTSAIHEPPALSVYKDIHQQLENIINGGKLVETELMKDEALFIEAVTLSKMVLGYRDRISNITKQEVLPINKLLSGIDKLKRKDFKHHIKVPIGDPFEGIKRHETSLEDFEEKLKQYIQKNSLSAEDTLVSPNSDLINVVKKYRFIKDQLTSDDRNFLIDRSVQYYEDVYKNYKKVIESNFPTSVNSFKTFSAFPLQIFLILEEAKRKKHFGRKLVYYNTKQNDNDVNVTIVSKQESMAIKKEYQDYVGWNSYWGLERFSKAQPIRTAVYELVKAEFEELGEK